MNRAHVGVDAPQDLAFRVRGQGPFLICNIAPAYAVSSVLCPPIESATQSGHSSHDTDSRLHKWTSSELNGAYSSDQAPGS